MLSLCLDCHLDGNMMCGKISNNNILLHRCMIFIVFACIEFKDKCQKIALYLPHINTQYLLNIKY